MEFAHLGLHTQAFHEHGKPAVFVHYQSQQAAYDFLYWVLKGRRGIGLLYGPESSGKKTLIRQFVRCLPPDLSVSLVDGARLKSKAFLETILTQFGYDVAFSSSAHWLDMLIVFVVQQTRSNQAPLLIVENFDRMDPGALRVLCRLAELRLDQRIALRLILVSQHAPFAIVHAPAMSAIENRMPDAFELGPMTERETIRYIHAKLRTGGSINPERLIPEKVCREIYKSSKGWPGQTDRFAEFALLQAGKAALTSEQAEPAKERASPALRPPTTAIEEALPLLAEPAEAAAEEEKPAIVAQRPGLEAIDIEPALLAQLPQLATNEVEPESVDMPPHAESAEDELPLSAGEPHAETAEEETPLSADEPHAESAEAEIPLFADEPHAETAEEETPLSADEPHAETTVEETPLSAGEPHAETAEAETPLFADEPHAETAEEETPLSADEPHAETAEDLLPAPAATPRIAAVEDSAEPDRHKLFVTMNGKTLQEFEMTGAKVLIGRSALCDLQINSRFISKFHAMLIRNGQAMYLVDLHSSNGTFVNSQRVQTKALRHDDVISLGNHGIKLNSPATRMRTDLAGPDLTETSTMKTLDDVRRARAQAAEVVLASEARE
jgi:type II secretory pathway predicted ATPase ExeA